MPKLSMKYLKVHKKFKSKIQIKSKDRKYIILERKQIIGVFLEKLCILGLLTLFGLYFYFF